jgi:cobalt/nickel transport protein
MPERRRRFKTVLLHVILVPAVLIAFYSFKADSPPYAGVDEAVVEKVARDHGRPPGEPLIDPDGDVLLFFFLVAGAVGGFIGGYYWRKLGEKAPSAERRHGP